MKNIRNWMLFAMILLIFNVNIGAVNLLPNFLGYLILAYCGSRMSKDTGKLAAMFGSGTAVLDIIFIFLPNEKILLLWLLSGIFFTLEMLLFYGLATAILQMQEREGLWIRRKILLLLYAICIVACGMALNVRPMFLLSGGMLICVRLYFLFALWRLMPKEAAEAKKIIFLKKADIAGILGTEGASYICF